MSLVSFALFGEGVFRSEATGEAQVVAGRFGSSPVGRNGLRRIFGWCALRYVAELYALVRIRRHIGRSKPRGYWRTHHKERLVPNDCGTCGFERLQIVTFPKWRANVSCRRASMSRSRSSGLKGIRDTPALPEQDVRTEFVVRCDLHRPWVSGRSRS